MNKLKIELYRDKQRNYRWRMKRCGRIIAESGEGYKRRTTMMKTFIKLLFSIESKKYNIFDLMK